MAPAVLCTRLIGVELFFAVSKYLRLASMIGSIPLNQRMLKHALENFGAGYALELDE